MGWTGGQYSLYRVALAILAATTLASAAGELARAGADVAPLGGMAALRALLVALGFVGGFVAVVALAVGEHDRLAAGLLAPFLLFVELLVSSLSSAPPAAALGSPGAAPSNAWSGTWPDGWSGALIGRTALLPALLLVLHARVPVAPFGSRAARGRVDPRGDWSRPAGQTTIAWALLALVFAARLLLTPPSRHPLDLAATVATALALVLALLGLASLRGRSDAGSSSDAGRSHEPLGLPAPGARPAFWSALVLLLVGLTAVTERHLAEAGLFCLLLSACVPSDWRGRTLAVDARAPGEVREARAQSDERRPARLFYDGDCGFCHRSVRFILAEEGATPATLRLRFAPLGGSTFEALLARHPELDRKALPDSIVLEREDGGLLVRSAAAREIAARLGGFWRLLASASGVVPPRLLDAGYDAIARVRKRLFAKPTDACPILPADLRARFDP